MSNIEDVVDSLENKVNKLLLKLEHLKVANLMLNEELETSRKQISAQQKQIKECEERFKTLKVANAILGSNDNKRETKLKINALIRDIDYCISQISS